MNQTNSESESIQAYLVKMCDRNYYNPRQSIIRVEHPNMVNKYYDFYLSQTHETPNPLKHMVILFTYPSVVGGTGINETRLNLPPGYNDVLGNLATIPVSICFLINKQHKISTADPQNGSAGFSLENINMFDDNKVRISISPPIDKTYTNNKQNDQDLNEIGLFMNDDSVMLRSRGGSVTLGDGGVHFGGNIFWEHSKHSKEIMMDNPLHGFIPQTLPTAIISIPYIPNFSMIATIADAAVRFCSIVGKINKAKEIIS